MRQKTFCALSVSLLLSGLLLGKDVTILNTTDRAFTIYADGWSLFNPFAAVQYVGIGDKIVINVEESGNQTLYFVQALGSLDDESTYVEEFFTLLTEVSLAYQTINSMFVKMHIEEENRYYLKGMALSTLFGRRISSFLGFGRLGSLTLSPKMTEPTIVVEPYEDSFVVYVQERLPYTSVSSS